MNLHADVLVMLRDFGVRVVHSGRECRGLLDSFDEQILASGGPANAIGRQISLICATGELTAQLGAAITIDGRPHVVREKYQLDDGLLTRFVCSKGNA